MDLGCFSLVRGQTGGRRLVRINHVRNSVFLELAQSLFLLLFLFR